MRSCPRCGVNIAVVRETATLCVCGAERGGGPTGHRAGFSRVMYGQRARIGNTVPPLLMKAVAEHVYDKILSRI